MLSKKMAFSLMSLITILVFGLIASPTMAAKIAIAVKDLDAAAGDQKDISFKDGIQAIGGATVTLEVTTDEIFGSVDTDTPMAFEFVRSAGTTPTIDQADITRSGDGKKYTIVMDDGPAVADGAGPVKVTIYLQPNSLTSLTTGTASHAATSITIEYIPADPDGTNGVPMVVSAVRSGGATHPVFEETFTVIVTLSEQPKEGKFTKDMLSIKDGLADIVSVNAAGDMGEPTDGDATGGDNKYYLYSVTLMPKYTKTDPIKLTVNHFEDQFGNSTLQTPGQDPPLKEHEVAKVAPSAIAAKTPGPGMSVGIPNDTIIPAGGYLVVVRDDGDGANEAEKSSESMVIHPGDRKATALVGRSAVKQLYNVVPVDLKYDLEGFLIRGGTIDLIAPDAGVMISEIMWGTDGGDNNRQWIEIHNTGSTQLKTKDYKLMLYTANEALPDKMDATKKIMDRVSTLYKGTNHWSVGGKGQSGNTVKIVERPTGVVTVTVNTLISMERVMDGAGMYLDGTMESSWGQSNLPSQNFMDAAGGLFVGSPGASPINPVADPIPEPEPEPVVIPVAGAMDIVITEIMVDTGSGRLPQWIELTNVSGAEKSLDGWSLMISNAAVDASVIGATVNINLSGTLGVGGGEGMGGTMGKSLLLVGGSARSSSNLAGNERVVDISSQVNQRGRYTFMSAMGFMAALIPPQMTGILTYGDTAGNLGEAWELPTDDAGRSSLIRREMDAAGMMTKGTDADGWVLASDTPLVSGPATWYGSDEDEGTPGYDSGGPLPVELSHFRPARDKATGAVVITWATQSELNNAGFFIKRSNQRNGEFQVINATMVPGAGTTSEKQFYTYTDTTAQPNIVYYYQIEDVSLDGNRQTLTNGIRLKGHIGAAGKLASTWGELKSSNE